MLFTLVPDLLMKSEALDRHDLIALGGAISGRTSYYALSRNVVFMMGSRLLLPGRELIWANPFVETSQI